MNVVDLEWIIRNFFFFLALAIFTIQVILKTVDYLQSADLYTFYIDIGAAGIDLSILTTSAYISLTVRTEAESLKKIYSSTGGMGTIIVIFLVGLVFYGAFILVTWFFHRLGKRFGREHMPVVRKIPLLKKLFIEDLVNTMVNSVQAHANYSSAERSGTLGFVWMFSAVLFGVMSVYNFIETFTR